MIKKIIYLGGPKMGVNPPAKRNRSF